MDILIFAVVYLLCGYGSFEIFLQHYSEYIENWPRGLRVVVRSLSIICWPIFGVGYVLHAVVFIVVALVLLIPVIVTDVIKDILE